MRNISLQSIFSFVLLLTAFMSASLLAQGQVGQPPVEIDVLGTCIPDASGGGGGGGTPASTKFFVRYSQQPDSVYWLFELDPLTNDSLGSRQLQPIHTFSEAGTKNVVLHAVYGEDTVVYPPFPVTIQQSQGQLQIKEEGKDQPVTEVVLCPGETKTLTAEVTQGGGSGGGGGGAGGGGGSSGTPVTWYKPQSSEEPNPVVDQSTITVGTETTAEGKYKDVGTYYVVYDDGNNCPIYQTFRVIIYEQDDQNSSRWFFGDNAGIDFMNGATAITSGGAMAGGNSAPEGNSLVGDQNADVLFLTNGESLWYGNDPEAAANGNNLGGSRNVAQNSLFVDFPADETLFYLFTINSSGQFSFSTMDLKSATPPPGVAISEQGNNEGQPIKTIPLHTPVAEKLTSTSRTAGGVWVVVHELNSDVFLSYPVSAEGVGTPTRSSAGSFIGSSSKETTGYMRFSENGKILATTVNQGSSKFIELFRFDADSGLISNPIQIPVDELNGTLYGLEFADNRLYATVSNPGGPSYLYQFTVDSTLDRSTIEKSTIKIPVNNVELGAAQVGPDGQLYIARNGEGFLYRIPSPSDSLDNFQFNPSNDFELAGGSTSTLGLPNFGEYAGTSIPEATISATSVCVGDSVSVSATQRYSNDISLRFELLDENQQPTGFSTVMPASGQGAEIMLAPTDYNNQPGTYFVRLSISNECDPPGQFSYPGPGEEPILARFTVSAKPDAELVTDQTLELCENQSVTFIGRALIDGQEVDPSTVNFVWFDALSNAVVSTGPELTVEEPGAWRFFVANGSGCTSDTLNVEAIDLRPQAELGDDFGICAGSQPSQSSLEVSFPPQEDPNAYNFAWFLRTNEGEPQDLGNTTRTQSLSSINTDGPGTYQFIVEVTAKDPSLGNCFKADSLTITVAPAPEVQIVASNNNCNGRATLTAEVEGGNGNLRYTWSGPGIMSGAGTRQIVVNQSGDYTVNVTDDFTQCSVSSSYSIDLQNPLGNIELEVEASCSTEDAVSPSLVRLQTSYSGALNIRWFNLDSSEELAEFSNQREIEVGNGTYRAIVEINNPNCSVQSDSAEVEVRGTILPRNQLQSVYVICPAIPEMRSDTLQVSGFDRYEWRNVSTGQVVDRDSVFIVTQEGTYELRVNECQDPVQFQVVTDCTPKLWLPNAIRIDGVNNTFKILNDNMLANIRDFQIIILNRWGEVIWQSQDPSFEWRGTNYQGRDVMVNTYVYVITYRNSFGEDQALKRQRGGITVLK